MSNCSTVLVVVLLREERAGECRDGSENLTTFPDSKFSFQVGIDTAVYVLRGFGLDLFKDSGFDAVEHSVTSRENNIPVEISSIIGETVLNGVYDKLLNAWHFLIIHLRIEEILWTTETFIADYDAFTIRHLVL